MDNIENVLKLMTYNIHSGKNLKGQYTLPKIIDFIKNYSPDILALQEINENKKRGFQIREIKEILNMNVHFGPHVHIGKGQYGIATVSPFEIIGKQHILLPSIGEQRGMIHTQLRIKSKDVHILNTHLGLNILERKKQFQIIQKYLEGIKDTVILMGDFNTTNLPLQSSLIYDASQGREDQDSPTLIKINKKIDFIMLSKNIQTISHKVVPVYFSDHFPVMAKIII
ncbi:endonuclease/exonuclease/phosphatase family protein [Irregularibacter muris]|uniref:Endonuclease/exonuclease/phosphatase family protein n=1 Tax=Irregularibacter muris TaxID=1796619 RepID=A0AAE3KZC5_9FIRM|nr:endonuclease/exonuclease/phosphatase family protein [Irregularibacter muris]MCR1898082.1 endonuclease/exonuclease/phosphatase family protein [Irregularibacter muris]